MSSCLYAFNPEMEDGCLAIDSNMRALNRAVCFSSAVAEKVSLLLKQTGLLSEKTFKKEGVK